MGLEAVDDEEVEAEEEDLEVAKIFNDAKAKHCKIMKGMYTMYNVTHVIHVGDIGDIVFRKYMHYFRMHVEEDDGEWI